MNEEHILQLRKLLGNPIKNVSELSKFVEAFNKAGVEISYGTSLMGSDPINGEPHVYIECSAGFDSESWSRRGTVITCISDENDGYIYRLAESSGWWFEFRFSLNCIVTDIEWDTKDEYLDELPSIVISRFYMSISNLLNEHKRREMIMKSLEAEYEVPIKSIGQVIIGPSKKIHIVHPNECVQCDLTETFVNNNAMSHDEDE